MLLGCKKNVMRSCARVVPKGSFGPVRRRVGLGSRIPSRLFFTSLHRKASVVASSIRQLQLSPSIYSRSLGATAMFSTASGLKEPVPQVQPVKEDSIHINEPMIESNSSPPRHFAKQEDSTTSGGGEFWPHSVDTDSDMTQVDTMAHVVNLREELGTSSKGRVLRVKSGNRLPRHNAEKLDHESRRPLVRECERIYKTGSGSLESSSPKRQHSFRDDVEHAASETFLLTRLTFSLLRYLGVGYRWVTRFLALGLYAMFLMPGFIKVGYKYFFSKTVHRSIVYGSEPRNRLDLYMPENADGPLPVFIFVTGGAWIIGYKAWGSLLGLQLLERDIIVCCVDYRNFPQGGISDMVEDVSTGIGFVVNKIEQYGGDPERIYLGGQSAGSHLAACSIVEQARKEIGQKDGIMTWRPAQLKAFVGISGGYHLPKLVDHFHGRGLYKRIFLSIMEGETSLPMYSPELAVQSEAFAPAVRLLPPIYLFHGTADYSIPCDASTNFGRALQSVGATVHVKLYPDKTHTDVFIQDPMRGGYDALYDDLLAVVHADDPEARARDKEAPLRKRLVPEILLKFARYVSPF